MTRTTAPAASDALLAVRLPLSQGRFDQARVLLEAHLRQQPNDPRGWGLLGHCLRNLRQFEAAEHALRQSLRFAPGFASSQYELALLRRDQGRKDESIQLLDACLKVQPANAAVRWELARLLGESQPGRALEILVPLLAQAPTPFELRILEAQLLLKQGELKAAAERFHALHRERPDSLEALEGGYWTLVYMGRHDDELVAIARALAERAPTGTRWLNLAQELQHIGDYRGGREAVERALAAEQDFPPALWARFQLPETPAPQTAAAADAFCTEWDAGLQRFEAFDFSDPHLREQVWGCVGQCTAFYRHYLGDEVALQHRYGQLVERMMAALVPAVPMRSMRKTKRRIGFVSAHFREHTVCRLFAPLIEALDREQFEVFVFSLDDIQDRWSKRLQAISHFEGGRADAPVWRQRILAAELDVLVYPEVGMHPMAQGLAALRLAPVQMVLWGHPISTGMSTIDAYLTPDALEPEDAVGRYSERLVRLPELGHALRREDLPKPVPAPIALGEPGGIELLCAQTVYKLLPQQDALFGRILAALPEARLNLLADHREIVRHWLRERMAPTLRAAGADPERQLHIHGFVKHAEYLGLAGQMRLNLDTVGWSGGMSALDLLAQGLPTICLPGDSMRSRQTAMLLKRLDLEELIALDEDDYVEKVVTLARDPARCAELSATLRERSDRLFAAPETSDFLNRLLAGVERQTDGSLKLS